MKFDEITSVGVLGGGIMGGGIAQGLAIGGYPVVIRDISDEAIEATRQAVFEGKWGIKRAVELGKLKFDDGNAAIARVSFTTALDGLANCDFIIEAIPEKLELKQEVFKELDSVVKPDAIEFWQGRPNRLHDRFRYTRQGDGSWLIDRLAP